MDGTLVMMEGNSGEEVMAGQDQEIVGLLVKESLTDSFYSTPEKHFHWTVTSRFAGGPATSATPVVPTDYCLVLGG